MAKFIVTGEVTISVRIEVDAENESEARDLADEAPMQQLCHHCATGDCDAWSTSGELDGTPRITDVRLARARRTS